MRPCWVCNTVEHGPQCLAVKGCARESWDPGDSCCCVRGCPQPESVAAGLSRSDAALVLKDGEQMHVSSVVAFWHSVVTCAGRSRASNSAQKTFFHSLLVPGRVWPPVKIRSFSLCGMVWQVASAVWVGMEYDSAPGCCHAGESLDNVVHRRSGTLPDVLRDELTLSTWWCAEHAPCTVTGPWWEAGTQLHRLGKGEGRRHWLARQVRQLLKACAVPRASLQ